MSATQPQRSGTGADVLARATAALREEPERGWSRVSDAVLRRVRAVGRSSRPVLVAAGDDRDDRADRADGAGRGVLRVAEHVVADTVRQALRTVPGCRPVGVRLDVTDGRLGAANVEVAVGYGSDARAVAAGARAAVVVTLPGVVGPVGPLPVDVAVVDVLPPARP